MKNLLCLLLGFLLWQNVSAQVDDVYYDPADAVVLRKKEVREEPRVRDFQDNDNDKYYGEDRPSNRRELKEDREETGYQDDEAYGEDYDYYYSTRIRRFHRPLYGMDFFDPYYVDLGWYDPFAPGINIYIVNSAWRPWGWNRWHHHWGWNNPWAWNDPWNDPWNSWNHWGWGYNNPWGWNSWNNWGWGYNNWGCGWNAWNYSYSPFWYIQNNYYYINTPVGVDPNTGYTNYYYGPRKGGSIMADRGISQRSRLTGGGGLTNEFNRPDNQAGNRAEPNRTQPRADREAPKVNEAPGRTNPERTNPDRTEPRKNEPERNVPERTEPRRNEPTFENPRQERTVPGRNQEEPRTGTQPDAPRRDREAPARTEETPAKQENRDKKPETEKPKNRRGGNSESYWQNEDRNPGSEYRSRPEGNDGFRRPSVERNREENFRSQEREVQRPERSHSPSPSFRSQDNSSSRSQERSNPPSGRSNNGGNSQSSRRGG